MSRRSELLSDTQWEKIGPLLPELKSRGRPWRSNRAVFEGILWVLRSGARWHDLPDTYPSASTCWRRLRRWEEDRTWLRVWRTFIDLLDQQGLIDWEETFIDGSFAPAKKGGPQSEKPNAERVRILWWWQTARVFLSEATFVRPHLRK
jgi:transposase